MADHRVAIEDEKMTTDTQAPHTATSADDRIAALEAQVADLTTLVEGLVVRNHVDDALAILEMQRTGLLVGTALVAPGSQDGQTDGRP